MSLPVETHIAALILAAITPKVKTELECIAAIISNLKKKKCDYCGAPGCIRKYCNPYHEIKRTCKGDKKR